MQILHPLKAIFFRKRTNKPSDIDSSQVSFDTFGLESGERESTVDIESKTPQKRLLSYPIRRYVQGQETVERPEAHVGKRHWIVGRGLCLYRRFNLSEVPFAERKNALSVRILQWSPFLQTGQYVSWKGDIAQVWIWDELLRLEEMHSMGVNSAVAFPESVLNPQPEDDIPQLVACKEGVEGRIWNEGVLMASRWWKNAPRHQEWTRFLLGNDVAPGAAPPLVESFEWLPRPWARRSSGFDVFDVRTERFWIIIGLLVFSGIFMWKGVELWRLHESIATLEPELKVLSQQARPLKNARAKALQYKEQGALLLKVAGYSSPLKLFHQVVHLFPTTEVAIEEWRYTKDELEFIIKGKNLAPVSYINAFQDSPFFTEVTAEKLNSGKLRMHMKLNSWDDLHE